MGLKVWHNQGAKGDPDLKGGETDEPTANTAGKQYWWGSLFLLFGLYILGSYISAGPALEGEQGGGGWIEAPGALLLIGAGIYLLFFGKSFFARSRETLEYYEAIAMAMAIAMAVRAFVVEPFKIPSGSMIPTLLVGDYLFVSKFAYGYRVPFTQTRLFMGDGPQRGDVAVFEYPRDPSKDYIKRIVGLPGDRIVYRGKRLYINNVPVTYQPQGEYRYQNVRGSMEETVLFSEQLGEVSHPILVQSSFMDGYTDQVVPPGHYFVMGDNRDNSNDSRAWGFVPAHRLVGKALRMFWSWDQHAEGLFEGIRWDRFWNPVH